MTLDSSLNPERQLLGPPPSASRAEGGGGADHAVRTAAVFTKDALDALGHTAFPQRAVYGRILSQHVPDFVEDVPEDKAPIYINTNAPFSAVVCGVQGSGKSHSTATLLESCLIKDPRLGTLPAPLSGLVFHFDTAAGGCALQPCEAAYLAALSTDLGGSATPPSVTVLVLPNNVAQMRQVYAGLPGVKVAPLHFSANDISGERLLAMMKVETDQQMPLYMESIMTIMRSMTVFDYRMFRTRLDAEAKLFQPNQKAMLSLRLNLLDSCLKDGTPTNRVSAHFKPGQLTIIDLSSPFMDASSACSFFDIILGLFIESRQSAAAKIVVLDEAHKYLSENGSSSRLTESLLSVIRQQRHLNIRTLISTQEPTVVPSKFLDLCSFILAHRFSSPLWLKHLAQHVSAAGASSDELAKKVVGLQTGEALLFAPAGLGVRGGVYAYDTDAARRARVAPLGQGYLVVRSRLRITRDGGQSLLAVQDPATATRLAPVVADAAVAQEGPATSWPSPSPSPPTFQTSTASLHNGWGEVPKAPSPSPSHVRTFGWSSSSRAEQPATTVSGLTSSLGGMHLTPKAARVPPQFRALVQFLREQRAAGYKRTLLSHVGGHRAQNTHLYPTEYPKLGVLVAAAQDAGLVRTSALTEGPVWVKLLVD